MFKQIRKRALESYTDSVYLLNFHLVAAITFICLIMVFLSAWLGFDSAALTNVLKTTLVLSWSELSVHTGLIIWKAKAENAKKFGITNIETEVPSAVSQLVSEIGTNDIDPEEYDDSGILG